jgi:hypothetical protein
VTRYAVALVEGFHDRDFFAGLLTRRGWMIPREQGRSDGQVISPGGEVLKGGRHGYRFDATNAFLEVRRCGGDRDIIPAAKRLIQSLSSSQSNQADHLILCWDADVRAESMIEAVRHLLRDQQSLDSTPPFTLQKSGLPLRVDLCFWGVADQLPMRNGCLEAVVYAASIDAHPPRSEALDNWMKSRPNAPAVVAKNYMWSLMAGWHADRGCEDFLRQAIWQDAPVCDALLQRLRGTPLALALMELERG